MILLPDNKKLRQIYAYLLLKAIEYKSPVVSYEDVGEAVAVAGVTPNKYQVKKYLLILRNHNPQLLKFYKAGLFNIYYHILIYRVEEDEILQTGLQDIFDYRDDLSLTLSDELTENTLTYATLLKQRIQERGVDDVQ